MKIFNTRALTRQQRFNKAVIFGSLATIGCIILMNVLWYGFFVYSSLLYVGAGFVIGYAIQHFGRGVQVQFSVLAVLLTLAAIIISDLLIFQSFSFILRVATSSIFDAGYRLLGLYLAYSYSRVV